MNKKIVKQRVKTTREKEKDNVALINSYQYCQKELTKALIEFQDLLDEERKKNERLLACKDWEEFKQERFKSCLNKVPKLQGNRKLSNWVIEPKNCL